MRGLWLAHRPCERCGMMLAHQAFPAQIRAAEACEPDEVMTTLKCTNCGRINHMRARDYAALADRAA